MPGARYADALRVVGQLLDAEGARLIEIDEEDDLLTVYWYDPAGDRRQRSFRKSGEMPRLIAGAMKGRGAGRPDHEGELGSLLRTLGQDLDRSGITLGRIRQMDGFRVRAFRDGQLVEYCYSADELHTKDLERQTPRAGPPERRKRSLWRMLLLPWRRPRMA